MYLIQNYKNNLVLSFWQGKIRALLHEIADTMRTRKKKNPLRVSSNGIFCAQYRNNDILLRYTNKRKNVRIATYTHVFLCLNIILAEQTSR